MTNKDDEQVLGIKSDIIFKDGIWQGLKTDNLDHYINLIKNNSEFRRRGDVENDPTFQQIIPYIIFSYQNNFFAYKYIKNATEKRLVNNNYQIGIAGHINKEDVYGNNDLLEAGMNREWNEEIDFQGKIIEIKLVGIVKDESNSVEQAHIGVIYHFVGDSSNIKVKETDKLEGIMIDLQDLLSDKVSQSPWMQIVCKEYLKKLG